MRDPNSERRSPSSMIFAASDCRRRHLEGRSKARTTWRRTRDDAARALVVDVREVEVVVPARPNLEGRKPFSMIFAALACGRVPLDGLGSTGIPIRLRSVVALAAARQHVLPRAVRVAAVGPRLCRVSGGRTGRGQGVRGVAGGRTGRGEGSAGRPRETGRAGFCGEAPAGDGAGRIWGRASRRRRRGPRGDRGGRDFGARAGFWRGLGPRAGSWGVSGWARAKFGCAPRRPARDGIARARESGRLGRRARGGDGWVCGGWGLDF